MRDRAFEGAQWVMATQAARAVAKVNARLAVGSGPLAALIRERQNLEETLERAIAEQRNAIGEAENDLVTIRQQSVTARRALSNLDRKIVAEFPEYAELSNPRPLPVGEVQNLLREGEALILFLTARAVTYVWVITPNEVHWHRSDLGRDNLTDLIRQLRIGLDPTGALRAAVPLDDPSNEPTALAFDQDIAHTLYRELLSDAADVLKTIDHIMVIKDGPLSSLPLSVLLTEPVAEASINQDYRSFPWLIRTFATTTLPAVASLATLRRAAPVDTSRHSIAFMGFGDPVFSPIEPESGRIASRSASEFFQGRRVSPRAFSRLLPLPGTAAELDRIAGLYPATDVRIETGIAATETAVKTAALADARIISFATHGLLAGDFDDLSEPALAFTPPNKASALDDGLLTASEAAALDLTAEWVVLSACNTAAGDGTPGAEGLSGLGRAFLFAGAKSLLVSHWPVRDDVAGDLTTGIFRRLAAEPGLTKSEALRLSTLAVIDNARDAALAHPSAWAPFVLVGDVGGQRRQ